MLKIENMACGEYFPIHAKLQALCWEYAFLKRKSTCELDVLQEVRSGCSADRAWESALGTITIYYVAYKKGQLWWNVLSLHEWDMSQLRGIELYSSCILFWD